MRLKKIPKDYDGTVSGGDAPLSLRRMATLDNILADIGERVMKLRGENIFDLPIKKQRRIKLTRWELTGRGEKPKLPRK